MDILCNYCGRRALLTQQCRADGIWYCLDCAQHHTLDCHVEPEGLPALSAAEQDIYALYHREEDTE